jgi:tricorn protease
MASGYYRFPTIHSDTVVFVCEDDLWTTPAGGGIARRLTSNLGLASRPVLSPDGTQLAFAGREEGQAEVFLMPAAGGPARRLTYMGGGLCRPVGWASDDQILFTNNAKQPFGRTLYLYRVGIDGEAPERINVGPAAAVAYGPRGGMIIGRNTGSPAYWKRYRGGSTGQLWIDEEGEGAFRPLLEMNGNRSSPMWLEVGDEPAGRIFFLSDHEGVGNLYSCRPDGDDVRRHTDHEQFYARNAATDGTRIVYHVGADLYLYDPVQNSSQSISIEFHSPQTQRNRKFVRADKYLDSWALHPDGHSVAITSRGKAFSMGNWEGAVLQHGETAGSRTRLLTWLNDGKRLIGVSDDGGEESFTILNADGNGDPEMLGELDTGRPVDLAVNPKRDQIIFSNHRYEILHLDLATRELQLIDRGKAGRIAGFAWSPDGEWVAYSVSVSQQVTSLKLWQRETGEIYPLTRPVLADVMPSFDPEGKYLYFLSYRHFDPVYDNMQFDLSFPRGVRPHLITLRKDLPSPFVQVPRAPGEKKASPAKNEKKEETKETTNGAEGKKKKEAQEEKPIQIDVEGIESRVIAFPVEEALYGRIVGLKGEKLLYSRYPVEGSLNRQRSPVVRPSKGTIFSYDMAELKEEMVLSGISDFLITDDTKWLIYRAGNRLRVLKAGAKPDKQAGNRPGRKSGWLNLGRVKVSVDPAAEWGQMYREAWRLQRDQFWSPDMSQVDWLAVYERYLPLLERVSSRSEFSDLMWEMQGELGTSHCYEMGGDYRPEPKYDRGHLGADFSYDAESGRWQIDHIVTGDSWDKNGDSPLNGPGIGAQVGDVLLAINGRELSRTFSPAAALVNLAGEEVTLTFAGDEEESPRSVTVRTLRSDAQARYREWVEGKRRQVHEATGGRIGYVHIPDMGPRGYAEFHRGYLAEVDREGLIVDVRFNGGGHVSPLILEKLARRRIGRIASRWGEEPTPFPRESVAGPMVALTNEHAGSDGDIFSHCFKLMGLGPLLGKRTWGGVVGINPRHPLVDGTMTTQPEFSFWFTDVGWGVENYGTDPDIEIDNQPQDYINGVDAQLERTIREIMERLEADTTQMAEPEPVPSRALPQLPPR